MNKCVLLLVPLIAGCYSYVPLTAGSAPVGVEVRARITGAASDKVAPILGTFDTRELTGSILENRGGELVLDVPLGTRPNVSAAMGPLRTRVNLSPADLVSLEQRKLDRVRTTMFVGGLLAGVGIGVTAALHSGGGGDQGNGPPGPPPINRIPITLGRIPF